MCSLDDKGDGDATQECLDANVLPSVNGSTKYDVQATFSTVHINVSLPANLTCKHCVFQWKYITGNSWGVSKGRSCVGCGAQNEEFYGCSDIAIQDETEAAIEAIVEKTTAVSVPRQCALGVTFSRSFDLTALMSRYCQTVCASDCAIDKEKNNTAFSDRCVQSCGKMCVCE